MGDDRLDGLLRADTLEEILKLLSPDEAVVAALRLQGKPDEEIAAMLGVERSTVTKRMITARKRIAREVPEAARWLDGRRRKGGRRRGEDPHPSPAAQGAALNSGLPEGEGVGGRGC